jgi:hypothetical protein
MQRAVRYGLYNSDCPFRIGRNTISLKSQVLNAEINGKYKLHRIATAISNSLSNFTIRIQILRKETLRNNNWYLKLE